MYGFLYLMFWLSVLLSNIRIILLNSFPGISSISLPSHSNFEVLLPSLFMFPLILHLLLVIVETFVSHPPHGFYLWNMPLHHSEVSAPSLDIQRHMVGGARELWPVLEGGARGQGDTQVVLGRSLLAAAAREWSCQLVWSQCQLLSAKVNQLP